MTATGGQLLGGRYRLDERIGHGGMAEVFRARDSRLGRDVAVKVLRPDYAAQPAFRVRFRREAQAAAALDAPTIVSVYDTGENADSVPYIVMEYVEGRTLREVLDTEGRLLPQRALELAADICSALDVAHAAGIVHRDIKPGNVMLTPAGDVKVMDFGIASAASDAATTESQTESVIGTAAYLSPEQARGEHVDWRSDVYSTGCLLYELVTGQPPFVGDSAVAVAYQHVREDPAPPSEFDETLPPQVDSVVLKALAKNPANRYQSAAEMRADLLRAAAGQPVSAPPLLAPALVESTLDSRPPLRSPREQLRRRQAALAIFGAVLVVVVLAVAALVHAVIGTDSGLVPAPSVVGLSQQAATIRLADAGLQVGTVTDVFDPTAPGTVIRQSPEAGIYVSTTGSVDLVVSKGVELTIVPQVIGQSQAEAVAALTGEKLTVAKVVPRDVNLPAGQVLDVQPRPGTTLPANSTVTLVVSSGKVPVPDVRGRKQDDAVGILERAGFNVGITFRDSTGPAGLVVDQAPVATSAPEGSTVVITVTRKPAPPTPSAAPGSPTPQPTDTGAASPTPSPS